MSETINSIDAYVVTIDGTATQYVRKSIVSVVAADVTKFDARETAAALVAGYQTVDFGGTVVGGNATGLANDATAYTASISIDGTAYPVSVVGSAAQTFTTLVTEINADLPGTEAAIDGDGNITVTSSTTGNTSKVVITDTDLFSSLTGFVEIDPAVDGDLKTDMMGQTLANGANMWEAYKGAVETYDSASNKAVLASAYVPSDLNATFSDVEVEAELAAIKTKLDSLQSVVTTVVENSNNKIL